MDDILRRIGTIEAENLTLRRRLDALSADAQQARRARTGDEAARMASRLSPGSLAGSFGLRGASDTIPDLGSPLLARLRDDTALSGQSVGRTDTFDGYANLLEDPTFETIVSAGTALTTTLTSVGWGWKAKYTLNSGTVATTKTIQSLPRSRNLATIGSSGATYLTLVFGANAADMDITLEASNAVGSLSGSGLLPSWLVGAVSSWVYSPSSISSITAYVELTDGSTTVTGEPVDLLAVEPTVARAQVTAEWEAPTTATTYTYRVRINITKASGAASVGIMLSEPQLAYSEDGSVAAYTPSIAQWAGSPVAAHVYLDANMSIADATDTTLNWTQQRYDDRDMWDSGTPGRLTIRQPGVYHLDAAVEWASNATGVRQSWFLVNGAGTIYARDKELNPLAGTNAHTRSSIDLELDTGDYVQLIVRQSRGAALDAVGSASTYMTAHLVR